ncbi:COMD5 protein, partial [Pterocles burchelli]|nr:COMD5 protein [Pterocles burchelli]
FVFFFTVTVNALEGKDCKESVKLIAESTDLSEEQLAFLISGMYTLLRQALRLPLSTFKQEVSSASTWSPDKLKAVSDVCYHLNPICQGGELHIKISLARALQPSILMLMKLSDGTAHRFEVPVAKFQELRYNVALILKEMNDLEKRSILKIQD